MRRTLLLLIALLATVPVATAHGATVKSYAVTVEDDEGSYDREDDSYTYGVLRFTALPGERNRVTVRPASRGRLVITDTGARLKPGGRCKARTRRTVVCSTFSAFATTLRFALGGGSDRLTVSSRIDRTVDIDTGAGNDRVVGGSGGGSIRGGDGEDRLDGGRGDDVLFGGRGRDVLLGGIGDDDLEGGAGRDTVRGGTGQDEIDGSDGTVPAADVLDAGDGTRDVLTYATTRSPVRIELGRGQGAAGDRVGGFDAVIGGRGADTIIGGPARERFFVEPGDRIDAGGGDDVILASESLSSAQTPIGASVACGAGDDVIGDLYRSADMIFGAQDCERRGDRADGLRTYNDTFQRNPIAVRPDAVDVEVRCTTYAQTSSKLQLRTAAAARTWRPDDVPADQLLGEAPYPYKAAGGRCRVTVPLGPAAQALLASRGQLPVTLAGIDSFLLEVS